MSKTCYIAAHEVIGADYLKDLVALIEHKLNWDLIFDLSHQPDVIVYAGGADINTQLYGERRGINTQKPLLVRDGMEIYAYQQAMRSEKPVWNVGICRGMQLLNVLNGGKLEQHVEGHDSQDSVELTHPVEYFGRNKKDTFGTAVNSYHHQMIKPPANGKQKHYPFTILSKTLGVTTHPEAIVFPKTNSIGVQWHPEWGLDDGSYRLFKRIIDDYVMAEEAA